MWVLWREPAGWLSGQRPLSTLVVRQLVLLGVWDHSACSEISFGPIEHRFLTTCTQTTQEAEELCRSGLKSKAPISERRGRVHSHFYSLIKRKSLLKQEEAAFFKFVAKPILSFFLIIQTMTCTLQLCHV